jgi:transglutaminase-like putative cysteine protease
MRYFLLSTVTLFLSTLCAAATKQVEFVQEFQPATQELIELWIPTPMEGTGYQKLISRTITGNATSVRIGSGHEKSAPYVYARWEKVAAPTLKIVNLVEIADRDGVLMGSAEGERYLSPTKHVQTDGVVKATADSIVAGIKDPDKKARAIYDWIVAKTARDPGTRGCGLGDVKTTLTSGNLKGKCADLNSLFVGLSRAAGIPAREVFGQRVTASNLSKALGKDGDNSKAQHCRAEYYSSARKGWVPVDPADVRKFILEENLAANDAKVKALSDKFFGYWEGTWIAFNFARDFQLEGFHSPSLNYFMYPLLASAKVRPDGVDPQETGYRYQTSVVAVR